MCLHNNQDCPYRKSSYSMQITDPQPEVLLLNINWDGLETSYTDVLKFVISIPSRIETRELFVSDQNETYVLRGLVCFLGAHYLTYIKH